MWLWQSIRFVSQNCWDTQYDILFNGNEFLMIFDVVGYWLGSVTNLSRVRHSFQTHQDILILIDFLTPEAQNAF